MTATEKEYQEVFDEYFRNKGGLGHFKFDKLTPGGVHMYGQFLISDTKPDFIDFNILYNDRNENNEHIFMK